MRPMSLWAPYKFEYSRSLNAIRERQANSDKKERKERRPASTHATFFSNLTLNLSLLIRPNGFPISF